MLPDFLFSQRFCVTTFDIYVLVDLYKLDTLTIYLQQQAMVDVAWEVGADAVSHGCTGKGNDQACFSKIFHGP